MKGTIVGSYRILDTISVGGMGTVYRAEHTLIGRLAAVKILHPELCTNRDIVNRFFNEAKTTTSIKHPGIVEVFDFGYMPSGHAYLIMEFLEGMPLSHRVAARGAIPEGEAALLLRSVCIALSAAHDKGVVHRDLKPDNIFVMPDPDSVLGERTKILDFGIAKLTDIGLAGTATKTGAVMGTPTYMSPEQCRGTGDVDHRADLYSIGCMFYELVAGRPPFVRNGAGELIGSHLFVDPEPPSHHVAGLSPEAEALIMTLLAKQPEARVQSAKELAQRLTLIAQHHGWSIGDISRPSLNHVLPSPASAAGGHVGGYGTPVFSPAPTPAALLATTLAPPGIVPSAPTPAMLAAQKPTTLSGAASQVAAPAPRRARRGLGIAIAGGLIAAAGGIGAVVAFSGSGSAPHSTTTAPAPAPMAATPAPPAPSPPTPTPTPAAVAPTPPAASPPVTAPAPAPVAAAPAPITPPPSTTSTVRPAPAAKRPPSAAPATSPAAKPIKKPAKKPDKDLLEQDI